MRLPHDRADLVDLLVFVEDIEPDVAVRAG
jgi:hypothetical protein